MLDLERLLAQPEGQYFERKSLWEKGPKGRKTLERRKIRDLIAEYVAAFANADGGTLVLGLEDDGEPSGHGYPAEAIHDMLMVPRNRLSPPLESGSTIPWKGHELLVFEVRAAERAVMVTGNGFPRRVHDQVIKESEELINALKGRARNESLELEASPQLGLAALDLDLVERAQAGAGLGSLSAEQYLCNRRLADVRGDQLVLRKGALLLFARQARDIEHPNAGVRIFRVDGTVRRTGARHNVRELPRIEGALPRVIERAYDAIDGLVRKSTRLHDLFFRETPEYPTFAWQEALVNALAHRDYRVQGRAVEVWVYDDRMEVVSPGALLPEVDLSRLLRREPVHASRNPRLTRILAELALMREQGEGIPRMFEEMEQSWLQLPEFRADEHSFTVILRNEPILETPEPEWVRYVSQLPLNPRQRRALVAFPGRRFVNHDYQNLNQVDRDTAYRELKELVDLGLLTAPAGPGRGARYELVRTDLAGAPKPTPHQVLHARMTEHGFLQNSDYRDVFSVDRARAKRELASLVDAGVLKMVGTRRLARYVPGPGWAAWVTAAQLRQ